VAAIPLEAVSEVPVSVVHQAPVWREKADFIIRGAFPDEEGRAEQLWARHIGHQRFEICCIPFYLYDVSLGDVVETNADYYVERVVEVSGRYVFRVWFGQADHPRQGIADELVKHGAFLEWYSDELLAVDVVDEEHAQTLGDYLAGLEDYFDGLLFETGRS
jgi:hypothetical protein